MTTLNLQKPSQPPLVPWLGSLLMSAWCVLYLYIYNYDLWKLTGGERFYMLLWEFVWARLVLSFVTWRLAHPLSRCNIISAGQLIASFYYHSRWLIIRALKGPWKWQKNQPVRKSKCSPKKLNVLVPGKGQNNQARPKNYLWDYFKGTAPETGIFVFWGC